MPALEVILSEAKDLAGSARGQEKGRQVWDNLSCLARFFVPRLSRCIGDRSESSE